MNGPVDDIIGMRYSSYIYTFFVEKYHIFVGSVVLRGQLSSQLIFKPGDKISDNTSNFVFSTMTINRFI
jgi:hypothetical protein